jgi:hypothetical protein
LTTKFTTADTEDTERAWRKAFTISNLRFEMLFLRATSASSVCAVVNVFLLARDISARLFLSPKPSSHIEL